MSKRSLREDILNAGLKVMFRSGYHGASVRDICAAAGAPQGSFTNHFGSKEAFAQEVLDRYFANTRTLVSEALNDKSLTARQRLKRYLDIISGRLEGGNWNRGCLIGDFSLEASLESKLLRERLEEIFREWRTPFAQCIAEAQAAGEIDAKFDSIDLAEFLLASWEGAILRMKVEQGPAALDRFKNIVFETVFATKDIKPGTQRTKEEEMTALIDAQVEPARLAVLDSTMAYREAGSPNSPTVLFLHGNPTSSYLWRNIIPLVAPAGHCIAPDLIGFGQSGKPDIEYRFFDHVRYLDAFLDRAGISSAYVVAHDWGTALAFYLAARRPEFVRGLAFMEFIRPMRTWDDFHAAAAETFKKFRTPGVGEKMILDENAFVEKVLPGATVRKLTEEEMGVYRAPFPTPRSRRPTWRLPNDLPIGGEPADVYLAMEEAHRALAQSSYPKLLFAGDPGALVSPAFAESFSGALKNCRVANIGPGLHYLPEENPKAIGSAIYEWLTELEAGGSDGAERVKSVGRLQSLQASKPLSSRIVPITRR